MVRSEVGAASRVAETAQPARYVKASLLLWSLTPTAWLVTFLALLLRARIALGEWPHARIGNPMMPNYSPATFAGDSRALHGDVLNLIWPFALLSPLSMVAYRVIMKTSGKESRLRRIALFGFSYALLLWIALGDPRSLWSWAMD